MPKMKKKKIVRIGYMKIKEIHGLLKIELIPISREEAKKLLRGEIRASEG